LENFKGRIAKALHAPTKEARTIELLKLFYFKGTDDETLKTYKTLSVPYIATIKDPDIKFIGLEPNHRSEYVQNGVEYRTNTPHQGFVSLNGKTKIPYGKAGGRYVFPGMISKVIKRGVKDKQHQIVVMGHGPDGPPKFRGYCEYLQSNGKADKKLIEDNGWGNQTLVWRGEKLLKCVVTLLNAEAELTIIVQKDLKHEKKIVKNLKKGQTISWP